MTLVIAITTSQTCHIIAITDFYLPEVYLLFCTFNILQYRDIVRLISVTVQLC